MLAYLNRGHVIRYAVEFHASYAAHIPIQEAVRIQHARMFERWNILLRFTELKGLIANRHNHNLQPMA